MNASSILLLILLTTALAAAAPLPPVLYRAFEPASLSYHIHTNIFSRMTGDPAVRRQLFSYRSYSRTNFIRNPDYMFSDIPGIEAYAAGNNSAQNGVMNGCLISPSHLLSVAHIGSQLNQIVYFVNRTNGTIISRKVIDYQRVGGYLDQTVALLNEPIPRSEILPAAVIAGLPLDKLPQYANPPAPYQKVPVISFNQDGAPGIEYLAGLYPTIFTTTTNLPGLDGWAQGERVGDSGSPCMTIINGRAVVIGNWTGSGGGNCTWSLENEVQTAMNLVSARNSFTNEALEIISLSNFTP